MNGKYWYRILSEIEFAINNVINKTTEESPNTLLFGCKQRGNIIDKLVDYIYDSKDYSDRNLDVIRKKASAKIENN